jgi:hypothetical protein
VEVQVLRERCDAAVGDAGAARRDADALREALGVVDAKLSEYQRKDAEVGRQGKLAGHMGQRRLVVGGLNLCQGILMAHGTYSDCNDISSAVLIL